MSHNDIFGAFFKSKRNANCILELEKSLLSDDESCVLSSIDTFKDVFTQVFNKGMLHSAPCFDSTEEKFRTWLVSRYNDCVLHLVSYLIHENEIIQEKSLDALVTLVVLEGENPLKNVPKDTWVFPKDLFEKIIGGLVSQHIDQQALIMKFQEYTSYDDVKMYLLKAVLNIFQHVEQVTDVFLLNLFSLLNTLKYPKEFHCAADVANFEPNTLLSRGGTQTQFYLKKKLFCKLFSGAWGQFLKFPLPPSLLKRVLLILHKRVIPHVQNPCLMTDFLANAYKQGGIVSLLALNGLFYLMDKHNVEYPDFFLKLYSLFDEDIVNGKFSSRFFFLSNLFLSSTHLPSYLVASFVKRLSRIALSSRTDSLLKIIPFICNLLIRHPTLNTLIHRTEPSELAKDPYNFAAPNPAESNALESSLWEIKTLQNHIYPEVARKAKLINHQLPIIEYDLSEVLDTSIDQLYEMERKRKFIGAPPAVQKCPKLKDLWILSNKGFS